MVTFSFTTYQLSVNFAVSAVISVQLACVVSFPALSMYAFSFAGRGATVVLPTTP